MYCLTFSYDQGWLPQGSSEDVFYPDLTGSVFTSDEMGLLIAKYNIECLRYVCTEFDKDILLDLCSKITNEIKLFIINVTEPNISKVSECIAVMPAHENISLNIIK